MQAAQAAQAALLPDGRRLHLHHGPIDLIVEAWGPGREDAYHRAIRRFENLLQELVDELPALRQPLVAGQVFEGSVAQRMQRAVAPHGKVFITPMAAVAGAVADEIVSVMAADDITKAYVNNGGDAAFYLTPGERTEAVLASPVVGRIVVTAENPYRGVATSGWRGRSHSLGIADAVSVVARHAASADAAATLIANAIDLPGHPAIRRQPASELSPDSDLGSRPVTVAVGPLTGKETAEALAVGVAFAESLLERGLIGGALLTLNGEVRLAGATQPFATDERTLLHA